MKRKAYIVFLLTASLLILVPETEAAQVGNDSVYVWNYQGDFLTLNYEYLNPYNNGNDSLYISNKETSEELLLIDKNTGFQIVSISETCGQFSVSNGTKTVHLGNFPEFTFKFSDDGIHFSSIYSLFQVDQSGLRYTISNSATDTTVGLHFYNGRPCISAVPIPGTVFLLGPSLLGLFAMRSRRRLASSHGEHRSIKPCRTVKTGSLPMQARP